MRLVALSVLMCLVCVASVAHASTGLQGHSSKQGGLAAERKPDRPLVAKPRGKAAAKEKRPKLILDEPAPMNTTISPTVKSITSLTNGDSLVNPWFPGRGAVGVNVKVTW